MVHSLLEKQSINIPLWALSVPFFGSILFFFLWAPDQSIRNFNLLIFLSPLWLPILLGYFAWKRWVDARQYAWNLKQQTVLLEIRIPREVRKTPLAMEALLSNMHLTPGMGTWYKKFFQGRTMPWYSLEIVSLGGRVHMYIWTRATYRHIIETYLYAQYPGVEVVEATDYTLLVDPFKPPAIIWGCEYQKKAPDPFPIKTYTDFQMDKQPVSKPEEVTDPLANVIEFMGSLNKNEQLWIHIMIRYTRGDRHGRNWVDVGKELIESIRKETARKTTVYDASGNPHVTEGFPNPTKGQTETIAAVGRNTDKLAFDVGMRAVYIATDGKMRDYLGAFVTQIFRPWGTASQAIGPIKSRWSEIFNDYPWEDPGGHLRRHLMEEMLEFTRRRAYFQYPYVGPWMVMSTEEIASIFHIPSSSIAAPNLPRIQSTTTEAPANLPT